MKLRANDAFTHMGLRDDVVVRYPWRFPVDDKTLDYLLTVELINGKPVLLNDGYLVNNEFVRKAIVHRDGLLRELVRGGFVRVMSRGGDDFGLHELPHKMAPQIPSFAAAVAGQLPGTTWKELERALKDLDTQLRSAHELVPRPSFDDRTHAVEKTLKLPPSLAAVSERAMRIIKRRQVPSTIQITPSVATAMAPRLRRFQRED